MKRMRFFAAIAVAAIAAGMVFTSCTKDSTLLGLDSSFTSKSPAGEIEVSAEEFVLQLDTTVNKLFTVEQNISFEVNTFEGNELVDSKKLSYDLNCSVEAEPQADHYVAEEILLQDDKASVSASAVDTTKQQVEQYVTLYSCSREYFVSFAGAGETVKYTANWQYIEANGKVLAHAEPYNLVFDSLTAVKDEVLSVDSLVYNTNLYVQVSERHDGKEYKIRTPWNRIYKNGEVPVPDEYETKLENEAYEANFQLTENGLETQRQNVSAQIVTYKNGEEISRSAFAKDLNLEVLFAKNNDTLFVEKESDLYDCSLVSASHSADRVTSNKEDAFNRRNTALTYNFVCNGGQNISANVEFQAVELGDTTLSHSVVRNVTFKKFEVSENAASSSEELKVVDTKVYLDIEVEKVSTLATRAEDREVFTYVLSRPRALRVDLPKDEIIGKRYEDVSRVVVDANTERISWTEVEIWSVSGEKTREISLNLYRHFSEPQLQWIYSANSQYTTVANGSSIINETSSQQGNWTITTRYMQYSSTANNGVDAFQNLYSYDYQKAVYSDEYYTLSFDYADWQIVEAGSSISATPTRETINGTQYDVYDYVNNINTVYAISGDSYNASAKAEAKIAVLPKSIPEEWGKILGAAISAVPADDEAAGDHAKKCLVIRTENGAVAVPFAMSETLPEVNNIMAGYFVEGNFNEEYNSGYFTTSANHGSYAVGKWAPAVAEYRSDEYPIIYSNNGVVTRSLSKYILAMWNWRDGNFSHVVDGYVFSASENGVLTITYNGEVVMQLR